jgi:hypothetical protein
MDSTQQFSPAFGPPLIGQTEKALNAILQRELAGTDVSEAGWVLLRLAGVGGFSRGDLIERAVAISKFARENAEVEIGRLIWSGLVVEKGEELVVTDAARDLQASVQSRVGEITGRLWGDFPADDLATAGRVLGTVLTRANAELGYSI